MSDSRSGWAAFTKNAFALPDLSKPFALVFISDFPGRTSPESSLIDAGLGSDRAVQTASAINERELGSRHSHSMVPGGFEVTS